MALPGGPDPIKVTIPTYGGTLLDDGSLPMENVCTPRNLATNERIGLLFAVMASLGSMVAALGMFIALGRNAVRNAQLPLHLRKRIISTHLDVYMFSLLLSDFIQSIRNTLSLHWVLRGQVKCGIICDMQGVLISFGDPICSMLITVIAVHTFLIIFLHRTPPRHLRMPAITVACMWIYQATLLVVVRTLQQPDKPIYSPIPYWCWLSRHYAELRIPVIFLWIWIMLGLSTAVYLLLFLYMRGNLYLTRANVPRFRLRRESLEQHLGVISSSQRISRRLLFYPVAYMIVHIPHILLRWLGHFQDTGGLNTELFFFFITLNNSGGVVDVLLLVFTRPTVLGFSGEMRGPHVESDVSAISA